VYIHSHTGTCTNKYTGKVLVIPRRSLLFGALMERTPHLLQPNPAKAADRMANSMLQDGILLVVLLDPNDS